MKKAIYFPFILYFCAVCGCLSFSPIVPSYFREETDPQLTFSRLKKDPKLYIGKKVFFGGIIVEISSNPYNMLETELLILQRPLDRRDIPVKKGYSSELFLAFYKGYLDRLVYAPGRLITIGGTVTGQKIKNEYGSTYTYPVILIEFIQLRPSQAPYYYPRWFQPKIREEMSPPFWD